MFWTGRLELQLALNLSKVRTASNFPIHLPLHTHISVPFWLSCILPCRAGSSPRNAQPKHSPRYPALQDTCCRMLCHLSKSLSSFCSADDEACPAWQPGWEEAGFALWGKKKGGAGLLSAPSQSQPQQSGQAHLKNSEDEGSWCRVTGRKIDRGWGRVGVSLQS